MIFNSRKILILIDRKNRCAMEKRPKPTNQPTGDDFDDGKATHCVHTVHIYIQPMGIMAVTSGTRFITAYDFLTSKRKMPSKEVYRDIFQNKHTFNGAIIFLYRN